MGLSNKIYGLVQATRYLFNIFCGDNLQQSEADRRVFRQFEDGEVKMMVFMHVDDILAHTQVTMERFAGELGEHFKVKSMVEQFGVEKARRTPAFSRVSTFSPSG